MDGEGFSNLRKEERGGEGGRESSSTIEVVIIYDGLSM